MKKIFIVIIILSLLIIGFLFYKNSNNYDGVYEIYVEKFDANSPDRHLIVMKDGKKTKKYKYITFKEYKDIIICYKENPAVNVFDIIDVEELVIVLPNDDEIIAKVIKEEK